jgi:hypothetical protein
LPFLCLGMYFDDWWAESGDSWYMGPLGLPPRNRNDINLSLPRKIMCLAQTDCLHALHT